jgi:hypothetical protein
MPMQCLKHLVGKIKEFVGDFYIELFESQSANRFRGRQNMNWIGRDQEPEIFQ